MVVRLLVGGGTTVRHAPSKWSSSSSSLSLSTTPCRPSIIQFYSSTRSILLFDPIRGSPLSKASLTFRGGRSTSTSVPLRRPASTWIGHDCLLSHSHPSTTRCFACSTTTTAAATAPAVLVSSPQSCGTTNPTSRSVRLPATTNNCGLTTKPTTTTLAYRSYSYNHKRNNYYTNMRHPWWFLATSTAFLSCLRWQSTLCESQPPNAAGPLDETAKNNQQDKNTETQYHFTDCPFYGCPLLPQDVHYNTEHVKRALEVLRQSSRQQSDDLAQQHLATAGNHHSVTLTLIGYKGGPLQDQINQDRAIVIHPFRIPGVESTSSDHNLSSNDSNNDPTTNDGAWTEDEDNHNVLLGVFDGHAPKGEDVSEFTRSELPVLVSQKLSNLLVSKKESSAVLDEDVVKQILVDSYVELDARAPAEESGGCTATTVLKFQNKVYVANAGDSRSILASYRAKTGETAVLYMSREDKPSLPDERARVESMGGQVYLPIRGTSRVVYHDPRTGAPSGLAMSRSIGDWAAGKLGVIPDPIVDVFDIADLVDAELTNTTTTTGTTATSANNDSPSQQARRGGEYVIELLGGNVMATKADSTQLQGNKGDDDDDDVYIFAICATDGMMDYLEAVDIASILGKALYDDKGAHPITAAEHLVFAAANAWQQDKQGRYRDDIAIAVSTLRRPPNSKTKSNGSTSEGTTTRVAAQ